MAFSSRASRALLFMQSCRQPSRPRKLGSVRHSSQYSEIDNPYDPSRFAKTLQRPKNLERAPSWHYPRAISPPTQEYIPGYTPSLWNAFKSILGWKAKPATSFVPAPFTGANNPYKAKKQWPPDFRDLHPKKQFHFEKTYRRRAKLAYARPQFHRRVKLLQNSLILLCLIYFVLIAEPKDMGTPFDGFRVWFFSKLKTFSQIPESTRAEIEKAEQHAREVKESRAGWRWWSIFESNESWQKAGEPAAEKPDEDASEIASNQPEEEAYEIKDKGPKKPWWRTFTNNF